MATGGRADQLPRGGLLAHTDVDPLWTTPYWVVSPVHHLKTNLATIGLTSWPFAVVQLLTFLAAGPSPAYAVSVLAFLLGQPIAFLLARPWVMKRLYPPPFLP